MSVLVITKDHDHGQTNWEVDNMLALLQISQIHNWKHSLKWILRSWKSESVQDVELCVQFAWTFKLSLKEFVVNLKQVERGIQLLLLESHQNNFADAFLSKFVLTWMDGRQNSADDAFDRSRVGCDFLEATQNLRWVLEHRPTDLLLNWENFTR